MSGPHDTQISEGNDDSREPMHLGDDLARFERELARLCPRDDRLNRDRLMFLAGQAAAGANAERSTLFGVNLVSRAWPAAFGAMTAVAAMLLVMVITKPESTVPGSFASHDTARDDGWRMWQERNDDRTVLSTLDAHLGDIEALLAREEFRDAGVDAAATPADNSGRRLLTPGRWHEVLDESESVSASPKGASHYLQNRGATS